MALAKTVSTVHGLDVENAYHRVEGTQIDKDKMTFQVRSYKDNSGLPHFADASFDCAYDLSGENAKVRAICKATHTAEVIESYKAAIAAQGV